MTDDSIPGVILIFHKYNHAFMFSHGISFASEQLPKLSVPALARILEHDTELLRVPQHLRITTGVAGTFGEYEALLKLPDNCIPCAECLDPNQEEHRE